ncbi:hypothetical protein ACFL0V_01230 [Nanoarchaeota archaeon]
MKKTVVLILILLFLAGCAQKEDEPFIDGFGENVDNITPADQRPTPEEVITKEEKVVQVETPEIPPTIQGSVEKFKLKFQASTEKDLDLGVHVELTINGETDVKVTDNILDGSGQGKVDIKASAPEIGNCEGFESVDVTYDTTGVKVNDLVLLKLKDPKPAETILTMECLGGMTYEVDVPMIINEENIELRLEDKEIKEVTLTHPVPAWETTIDMKWKFSIIFNPLDFDVDIDKNFVKVIQGGTGVALVTGKKTNGEGKITLTHTDWPDIVEQLQSKELTLTGSTAFTLLTSCKTKPGDYLYSVTGETKDTFKTSQDAVTLQVKPNPTC